MFVDEPERFAVSLWCSRKEKSSIHRKTKLSSSVDHWSIPRDGVAVAFAVYSYGGFEYRFYSRVTTTVQWPQSVRIDKKEHFRQGMSTFHWSSRRHRPTDKDSAATRNWQCRKIVELHCEREYRCVDHVDRVNEWRTVAIWVWLTVRSKCDRSILPNVVDHRTDRVNW